MTDYLREDRFHTVLNVGGRSWVCKSFSGGESTPEGSKLRPGGGRAAVALGGPQDVGDVSVEIPLDADGINNDLQWLYSKDGKAEAHVSRQPLDEDGNALGRALNFRGKLNGVNPGTADADGGDASLVEVTVQCHAGVS